MYFRRKILLLLICTIFAVPAIAQELGKVHFPVSCSEDAQEEFDHAVALLHHMTYPKAQEGFDRVLELDPNCAMAYWGQAMTLFQPLWPTRPSPEDLQRGWDAVEKANLLGVPTEREQLFLATTASFFQDPSSSDYWGRIRSWEEAMENLYTLLPDDVEAAAFFSLAHLATASFGEGQAHQERAAGILNAILEQNPEHPGAMHYTIHANDVQGRQENSQEVVRGYDKIAPRNPHALHMPTHIYVRLGEWENVILGNIEASEVAGTQAVGPDGAYVWDEFPHAISYLIYAYLQRGDDGAALEQIKRLRTRGTLQPSFKTAFHVAETEARITLERKAWKEAAGLVPREPAYLDWDRFTWPEAVTWFAKGLGTVHLEDLEASSEALQRIEQLRDIAESAGEKSFAAEIEILRLALAGWIAQYDGRSEESIRLMEAATRLEYATPKHPVTPAPILPAFEQLGDIWMEQEHYQEALAAYEMSLELAPHRFLSLEGAARAALASGDMITARAYFKELLFIAAPDSKRPALSVAKTNASMDK